ncbi:MAG: O-antigen ligase family protein [Polyangiaceae bacterium]
MSTTKTNWGERAADKSTAAALAYRAAFALFLVGVAIVPFMRPFNVKLLGSVTQIADLVFALTGLVWAGSVVLSRGQVLRRGRFYLFIGAYLAAMAVTTVVAPHKSLSRIVIQLYLVGLSVLSYNLVRTPASLRRTSLVWVGSAVFTAVLILLSAVLFYLVGLKDPKVNPVLWTAGSLPVGNYPRVRGFFENGNMTGNYLALSSCLSVGLAAVDPKLRRAGLIAAATMSAAALFTLSTALGGLALAIGIFAWVYQNDTKRWGGLRALFPFAVLGAIGLMIFTAGYPKRTDAGVVLAASPRWLTWNSSWHSFLKHPLFGNGLGVPLADIYYDAPRGVHEHLTDPHNAWLSVGGQLGLLGLAAFIALLGWLARGLRRLSFTSSDQAAPLRTVLLGGLVIVVYQAFSCSLEDMRHVWLLFGLMAGVIEEESREVVAQLES